MDSKLLDLIAKFEAKKQEKESITKEIDAIKLDILGIVGHKREGSETHKIGQLKVVTKGTITRSVNKEKLCELNASLRAKLGGGTIDELFTYKPILNLSAFRKLAPSDQMELSEIITTKDGPATLTIQKETD
ncbi:hypothetical protein [Photobacterium damselae]|uniref:DUF7173 family protein n=1 Tax=Photobacterium damselae TaxID=38293 RepID=UPI001F38E510|nr:hypothetical protein [Photobacterium damselae]UKA12955.1 hypothetical protein IHC91_21460 [Photobacterium damselae subsp. damselae]